MMRRVVYLSGPMTGWPKFNRVWFMGREKELKRLGWKVMNPHRFFGEPELIKLSKKHRKVAWWLAMARDLVLLTEAWACYGDSFCLYLHPEWAQSRGARAEVKLANWLGVECIESNIHS